MGTRLCVRNFPPELEDRKFKEIVLKHSPKGSRLTECKIMKDMKTMEHGKPKSKEFAFIAYAEHEDALNALRNLNNNPNVFKNGTRLIVDFAIENLKAINAKEKRIAEQAEKSYVEGK